MYLLYNGEAIINKAIASTISGTNLAEGKWYLAYITLDEFSLDTKILSSSYNDTQTYQVGANHQWKNNTIMVGTNGDIETWEGQLFDAFVSESYDLFGSQEEKFRLNSKFKSFDNVILTANLAKNISESNKNWASLIVKQHTGSFGEVYGSSRYVRPVNIDYSDN